MLFAALRPEFVLASWQSSLRVSSSWQVSSVCEPAQLSKRAASLHSWPYNNSDSEKLRLLVPYGGKNNKKGRAVPKGNFKSQVMSKLGLISFKKSRQ